jgi:biotin synthase-like enzyme
MAPDQVLATARKLESRAERYYAEASGKLKALPEVSRALKSVEKIRKMRFVKLMSAGP